MKIGIFDSGFGGLIMTKSLVDQVPEYDYIYLGDTARLPYGNRSQSAIYQFTKEAVDYLFRQDCKLIIVACNTASAKALRQIQQEYLPDTYPERRVLGVLIPAAEEAVNVTRQVNVNAGRVGILATQSTVNSGAYIREIKKLAENATIIQQPAPLLVPLIEAGGSKWIPPILTEYLQPFIDDPVDALILGCTHYAYLKNDIRAILPETTTLISQDEILPLKLRDYLWRHPEIENDISKNHQTNFQVTDISENYQALANELFQSDIMLEKVDLY